MDDDQLHGLILVDAKPRHKTATIPGTVTHVPHYPKKLKIYLNNASPFWQAVYWDKGKTYRKSCKTTDKVEAFEVAKVFYEHIILRKYQHPAHLKNHKLTSSSIKKARNSNEPTFNFVAEQWIARKAVTWTPRNKCQIESRIKTNISQFVGEKSIKRITKLELLALIQKVEARKAYSMAKRLLNDCRQIWHFAMVIDVCNQDITVGLHDALHGHSICHQKSLAVEELPEFMKKICRFEFKGEKIMSYALQLIALTFVRRSELLKAKWQEFDFDMSVWRIPAERMKMRTEHIVPLSKEVINLLHLIAHEYPSEDYVITWGNLNQPMPGHIFTRSIYQLGYKNKMSIHGFRAIASTILNEHGFRADVIERQLAHAESNQVRRAYNRAIYMNERVEMMSWWGNYLKNMCDLSY